MSVIVPVYATERYLDECLDSILAHPDDDIEIIAVNDASPDHSRIILDRRAALDPRLRVVHLERNSGLGSARNAGLAHACGAYIWFVDSDDFLPAGSVRAVLDRLAQHRPDVLVVDHAEQLPDGRVELRRTAAVVPSVMPPLTLADQPRLLRLAHSACTRVIRRRFLDDIGLRFQRGLYEDAVFSHHLLMAARRIDVLGRNCYLYRLQADGSITTSVSSRHFEVFEQYERLFRIVEQAGGAYETYRPELFCTMINHYLVILGNPRRLHTSMRKEFFRRIVRDYRRFLPAVGYPEPSGIAGLKHRLVKHNAFAAYASLRYAYHLRTRSQVIPRQRSVKATSPS